MMTPHTDIQIVTHLSRMLLEIASFQTLSTVLRFSLLNLNSRAN